MGDHGALKPLPRHWWAAALLFGAIGGLGQIPFALTPLALIAFAGAANFALRSRGPRQAGWIGFATGTGYFAVTLHWIVEPFLVDPVRHGWMAPFALIFISTGFALFWALAFGLSRWLSRGAWQMLALAVLWAGVEMTRSYILTGFPWSLLGYLWSETSAAQLVAYIGPFGLTSLTTAVIAALGVLRPSFAVVVALLVWAPSLLITPPVGPITEADAPIVRLVQPNAAQHEKWLPEKAAFFFQRQLDYTSAPAGPMGGPDLIIWPETAIPHYLRPNEPALKEIAAASGGTQVVVGARRIAAFRAHNSLAVIGVGGEVKHLYDKHHLVPFGEYIPLGQLTKFIGLRSFAARDGYGYSPGPGPKVLDLGPIGKVLPLICYEAIFPQDVNAAPTRPDWLMQITNDAWFGTFSGPFQHLVQARMRAIEQGLPMIRVANTGISAIIDARGHMQASIPLGEAGYLDHPVPPALSPTLYARLGDGPIAATLLLMLAGLIVRRRAFRH